MRSDTVERARFRNSCKLGSMESASPLDVFRADVLAGHVVLVTGGGTGICRGIAAAYARFGADVAIVSRKPDVIAHTAGELSAATGRPVLGLSADVRDPEA